MTATPAKLTTFEIESHLTQLPGWTVVAGKLHREYRFPNFGKAFGFMKTAAPAIEKMDHHPEWVQRLRPCRRRLDHSRCGRHLTEGC